MAVLEVGEELCLPKKPRASTKIDAQIPNATPLNSPYMSKHTRLSDELVAVPASGNDILCADVLHEIFKITFKDNPGTIWILQFTSQQLRRTATTFAPSDDNPSRNPANIFVAEAFRTGNIHLLQWAHGRGLRTNPWQCARGGCFRLWKTDVCEYCSSVELQACLGGLYTRLSPYDAVQALQADGRTDHAFQWYLDTIFFPALVGVHHRPEQSSLREYLNKAGHHLLIRAAKVGRLNAVLQLLGAGVPLSSYNRAQLARGASGGHTNGHAAIISFVLRDSQSFDSSDADTWHEAFESAGQSPVPVMEALLLATDNAVRSGTFSMLPLPAGPNPKPDPTHPYSFFAEPRRFREYLQDAYDGALESGNIVVLEWLHARGVDLPKYALVSGIASRSLASVQWVSAHLAPGVAGSADMYRAFRTGGERIDDGNADIAVADMLDWLLEHHPPTTPGAANIVTNDIAALAAENVWMSVVAVIMGRGYAVDLDSLWAVLRWDWGADLVASIVWLVRHGGAMTAELFIAAATSGNVGVLEWLRDAAGCPGYASVAQRVDQILANPDCYQKLLASETLSDAADTFAAFRCHLPDCVHTDALLL